MIKLFRRNTLLQLLLILGVGTALWLPSLLKGGVEMPYGASAPLYELLYAWLAPHPLAASLTGFLLVLVEGWLLTLLLYNNKLIPQNTLMPMLCYVLLMSHGTGLTLSPMVVVNLIMMVCVGQLMVPENLTITLSQLFSASALVALASLFYLPALLMVVPLIITFMVHSLYRWRHWVMLLLGFLAPYIIVVMVYFMNDRLYYASYLYECTLLDWSLNTALPEAWTLIKQAGTLFLCIVALLSVMALSGDRTTMQRENLTTVTIPLLGAIGMLGYSHLFPVDLQVMALPLGTLTSLYFLSRPHHHSAKMRNFINELTFILFIVLCF